MPADESTIEQKSQTADRAGHCYMNWNDLYDNWMAKIRDLVGELGRSSSIRCQKSRMRMKL